VSEAPENPADTVAFDVGNTSVKCALARGERWEVVTRVATAPTRGLAGRLREALAALPVVQRRRARSVACSVHPEAAGRLAECWPALGGRRVEFFGRELPVPIGLDVEEPGRVGTDRLLSALGALRLHGAPCVVVSAGTAVTVDLVDAEGRFAGGAIAPGFGLAARALHEGAAMLPLVAVEDAPPDAPCPGRDTTEALQRGIYWFCAGGVRCLVRRYRAGAEGAALVCTGTDAPLLLPALEDERPAHEPELIFRGMAAALETSA